MKSGSAFQRKWPADYAISFATCLYAIVICALVAFTIAATTNPDTSWMQWHLSRLGERGQSSALLINGSLIVNGLLMFMASYLFMIPLPAMQSTQRLIRTLMAGMGVCMIGLALVPFDVGPTLHKVFSYSIFLQFVVLSITAPLRLKALPYRRKVLAITCVAHVLSIAWFFKTASSDLTLLPELATCTFMLLWLVYFAKYATPRCGRRIVFSGKDSSVAVLDAPVHVA